MRLDIPKKKKEYYSIYDVIELLKKQLDDNLNIDWSHYYTPTHDDTLNIGNIVDVEGPRGRYNIGDDGHVYDVYKGARKGTVIPPYYEADVKSFPKFLADTPYKDRTFHKSHVDKIMNHITATYPKQTKDEGTIEDTVSYGVQEGWPLKKIVDELHNEGIDASLYMDDIKELIKELRLINKDRMAQILEATKGPV
jgi:acetylornithine deacetylase/succinyl-diaminopimelate desuccinylase-like protein